MTEQEIQQLAKQLRPQMVSDRFKYDATAIEDVLRIVAAARAAESSDPE